MVIRLTKISVLNSIAVLLSFHIIYPSCNEISLIDSKFVVTCASLKRYGVASSFLSSILSAHSCVISICKLGGMGESIKQFMMAIVFCWTRERSECK